MEISKLKVNAMQTETSSLNLLWNWVGWQWVQLLGNQVGGCAKTFQIQLFLLPNYFLLIKNTTIALLNSILILQKQVGNFSKNIFAHQICQFWV